MLNKEKQAEAREKLQTKTFQEAKDKRHILLKWATGTGKTRMAILLALNKVPKSILLNVKETNHKITWKKEFEEMGATGWWDRITCICYASLEKEVDKHYDVIINDECHGLSELRESYLGQISFDTMISLSATPGEEVEERLSNVCPYWESYIPMDKAIELGILPPPTIYVVNLELDNNIKRNEVKASGTKRIIKKTDREYYDYLTNKIDKFKSMYSRDFESWQMHQLNQFALKRKKFMAHCKTEKAKEILNKIKNKRYICFAGSIEQCNELGGKNVIHSEIGPKKRENIIEQLNNKEISNVHAVNMLKESMNIREIESGMMLQVDAKTDRGAIQVLGRCLRGDDPEFYFFKIKDTVDERYVNTALSSFNKKYIKNYDARNN